jgi:hypothetical protein
LLRLLTFSSFALSEGTLFAKEGAARKALEKKYRCNITFRGRGFPVKGKGPTCFLRRLNIEKEDTIAAIIQGATAIQVLSTAYAMLKIITTPPRNVGKSFPSKKKESTVLPAAGQKSRLKRDASTRSDTGNSAEGAAKSQKDDLAQRHEKRPRWECADTVPVHHNQDNSCGVKKSLSFHHCSPTMFNFLTSKSSCP